MSGLGTSLVLVTSVALGMVLWATESAGAPEATERHGRPVFGFGLCVAGSYLGEVDVVIPPDGPTFAALITIGADGTWVSESTVDFGAGGAVPYAFRSGGRGSWRRVGPNKLKATYLHFLYDVNGLLTSLEKIDLVATFTPGCESAAAPAATFSVYLPTQDPFGDDPPVFVGKADATFKRMPVH